MATDRRIHEPYISAAIIIALTAGFGYAAILVGAIALKIPIGAWWVAMAQAHGHAQLFGWAGLFVLGVGLFFVPRLRGTTLAHPELAPYALACYVTGITLRSLSQPLYASADTSMPQGTWIEAVGRSGMALSGIVELVGTSLVVAMLVSTFRRARPLGTEAPILPVRNYLATAFVSLLLASVINAVLAVASSLANRSLLPADWDDALVHLMIFGLVIPIAMSLSVRNLPLFMRLAMPPRQGLVPLWLAYVTGLALRLMGGLAHPFFSSQLAAIGSMLESGAILTFVWMLDVLLRRKPAWVVNRVAPPDGYVEKREATRKGYPDHGEFGRFELLVISAFAWLVLAAFVAMINGITALLYDSAFFNPDIERHAITVGFITLLIFGMAARMLPGFSGKARVASTRLVTATLLFGNLATISRVLPLFAPEIPGATIVFGISGTIGWLGVACLGANLWRTFHL